MNTATFSHSMTSVAEEVERLRARVAELETAAAAGGRAEAALRRREHELADFLENAAVALHWVGPDGTILWANQAELDLLGYTADEYIGHHIAEFHVDQDVIRELLQRLSRNETLRNFEARLRCRDGRVKHVEIDSNVLWEDGRFIHSRCFTRDVTELKGAREAIAIENARLYEESQRRAREGTALAKVGQALSRSLDMNRVLRLIVEEAQELAGAKFVGLMIQDEECQELAFVQGVGVGSERLARVRLKVGQGIAGLAVQQGVPVQCANLLEDPRYVRLGPAESEGFRSLLHVPLLAGGRCFGVLVVFRQEEQAFSPAEIQLFASFADQAALALENARLYDLAQRDAGALPALSALLQSAREEERARISRELHDELGQSLTGLKMGLAWLAAKLPVGEQQLGERLKGMDALIDTTLQTVRRISTELRPGVLDALGLEAAIQWQVREFQARTGIRCAFTGRLPDRTIDPERSTAVFRILQEALTNVARHAKATRVTVRLTTEDYHVILEVRDNGRGIVARAHAATNGLGLLGIRERALLFGGQAKIVGTRGKGTVVTVAIPLASPEAP